MERERKKVYLVSVEGDRNQGKAVFSSKDLALQFIKLQGLKKFELIEVPDHTRDGLIALKPIEVYLKEDFDQKSIIEGVLDADQAPKYSGTLWFDPLVPENGRGLSLYHSWIRNGVLAEPCLSFGSTACTCHLTLEETPMLRRDNETDGAFHCFAENQDEAICTANAMMKKHWGQLPVRAIAERDNWHLIEEEEMALDKK